MPLVPCPECASQVSPAATSCPHCGFPLAHPGQAAVAVAAAAGAATGAPAPAAEQVSWEGAPSLRALAVDAIATGLFALAVTVAVTLAYGPLLRLIAGFSRAAAALVAEERDGFQLAAVLFVVTVVGLRVARLVWRGLALRSHRYRLSNQRLLVETGVLSKTINELDMRTVDDVTLQQTAVQRLVGVGEIGIVSSELGSGRPRIRLTLMGIRDPRTIRELVRNTAYQATRGQIFTRST